MKFKTDLAQAAYEEIRSMHDSMESDLNNDSEAQRLHSMVSPYERLKLAESNAEKTARVLARAIEVAAKIEIECLKAQFEQDDRRIKMGVFPAFTSQECEHDWLPGSYFANKDNLNKKPLWICNECDEVRTQRPAGEAPR